MKPRLGQMPNRTETIVTHLPPYYFHAVGKAGIVEGEYRNSAEPTEDVKNNNRGRESHK